MSKKVSTFASSLREREVMCLWGLALASMARMMWTERLMFRKLGAARGYAPPSFFMVNLSNHPGKMKHVLVACECSQVVTTAFRNAGADAYSCDIDVCRGQHPEWHFQCDVRELLNDNWDMVIAHPPCTYLTKVSAVALAKGLHTMDQVFAAREFFMMFTQLKCPTCIENPIPLAVANLPRPSQWVCPSQFGHKYKKKTGLWLYNLPPLLPMTGYYANATSMMMHVDSNARARSNFHTGIAEAMAAQWLPII